MYGKHGKEIQIKMALYDAPNLTSGMDTAIVETVEAVSIFTPMFLLFIFAVVFIGGMVSQRRRTGLGDMPMWATIASLSTLMVSLPLTLTSGLIQLDYLVIIVVITIFSGFWLFMDRNRMEV